MKNEDTEIAEKNHLIDALLPLSLKQIYFPSILIDLTLLKKYGAIRSSYRKDDTFFYEGDKASYYYQIESGSVKLITISLNGREFIQGIFGVNESFGEPPLLGEFEYPSTASALLPSLVWKLPRLQFIQLLKENFEIHLKLDTVLCERLKQKSKILSDISFYEPEQRIINLIQQLKEKISTTQNTHPFIVPITRQQIADMTGMRVETAIRTIKRMEDDGKLSIREGKIYL